MMKRVYSAKAITHSLSMQVASYIGWLILLGQRILETR